MNDDGPKLSAPARRSLEARLAELIDERIPRLERELGSAYDPLVETALRDARDEARQVQIALTTATPLEDEPHDPAIVELGDTVTVRLDGAKDVERFTIVGELEARMDDAWVSERAPLGAALLGNGAGAAVAVQTPDGERRYEILRIERPA